MKNIFLLGLIFTLIMTGSACMSNRERRIQTLDFIYADSVMKDDPHLAFPYADRMLAIMGADIIDYRPYILKGEACVWSGRREEAQGYFKQALKAIEDPLQVKSMIITPEIIEGDKRLIEKRITFLKAGKTWKNAREFINLARADIEQNRKKGDAGK